MKKISKFLIVALAVITALWSCKKDENRVIFQDGTSPVLTSNVTGAIPLGFLTKNNEAIKLMWTNPNYQLNTGLSSYDVTYQIEIDTVGASFSNPTKKVLVLPKDVSLSISQNDLNNYLGTDIGLKDSMPHNIEVRIKSYIKTGSTLVDVLTSNILQFTVIPYVDPSNVPPNLYITGSGVPSSWTNTPPASQKFTYLGTKKYELVMSFTPGLQYKFLTKLGAWQPQYGAIVAGTDGVGTAFIVMGLNDGTGSDPHEFATPAVAGSYKIEVNLLNTTFRVTKL